jgi:hypothetical protein
MTACEKPILKGSINSFQILEPSFWKIGANNFRLVLIQFTLYVLMMQIGE